jgi:uncharacterized membrane protein YoaK (UPF0700 family)
VQVIKLILDHLQFFVRVLFLPVALGAFYESFQTDSIVIGALLFTVGVLSTILVAIRITYKQPSALSALLRMVIFWIVGGLTLGVVISRFTNHSDPEPTLIFFVILVLSIAYLIEAVDDYGSVPRI